MKFLLYTSISALPATLPSVSGSGSIQTVDYIQYSPSVGQGRDAVITALSGRPRVNTTIVHQAFINNTGFVRHYGFSTPPIQIMDAYRMNGSCIVEHWDVIADVILGEIDPTPFTG